MNDLENITVKKLFALPEKEFLVYNDLLQNLNGKNEVFGKIGKEIDQLSFSSVSILKGLLQSPTLNAFVTIYRMIYGLNEAQFLKMQTLEFYQSFNWLQNEIITLCENEKLLESTPDSKWKEAGIDRLNVFGDMNTCITLGKQYGKSPKEVEQWTYSLVFTLALHNKIDSEINKRFSELQNPPNNGNS